MPDSAASDLGMYDALARPSPVRCGLCNLPVVRSASHPPVLLHQTLADHGNAVGAVDFFPAAGYCPQEGAVIPDALVMLIPTLGIELNAAALPG